ncbi:MAG: hypothetical protein L0J87_09560 [Tetragenococcus koreensis]|nr:hypothetical protein [Tetragenococcus koreensis]
MKQIIDLVLTIVGVLLVVVPYIATMLIHTRNKYLKTIGNEAIKITSALEETDLGGDAKKQAATSKLNDMFGGKLVAKLVGLKLTPEQFADQVDAAVATLRTMGVKQNKSVEAVPTAPIEVTTTTTTTVKEPE